MLIEELHNWSNRTESLILDWADPSGNHAHSPVASFPLAEFRHVAMIVVLYLSLVLFGTCLMKSGLIRPLTKLTKPLQFIYNPLQIVLCSYMCVEAGVQAYRHNYSILPCNHFNVRNPVMANVLWLFYVSKILDFFDTFFIICNQKWQQLSFLHVYHHVTIFSIYWLNLRAGFDGDIYLTIILNGFIHTIMYTYYFVSAHTRNIWWKKYLTGLQLLQFLTMNVQAYFMMTKKCTQFPPRISLMYLIYIQSLFWLFVNFFIRSYLIKPQTNKDKKQQ